MATSPRRPIVPGMSVTERPMTGAQAAQFGMGQSKPAMPGVSVSERPMTRAQVSQFGLDRPAAAPAAPASTTGGAAPSGAAPASTVRSKMSAIGDRIGAGIRSMVGAGPAAAPTPLSAAPAATKAPGVMGGIRAGLGAMKSPAALLGAGTAVGAAALSNADLKQPTAQISTADYLNMPPEQLKALAESSTNESVGSAVEIDAARREPAAAPAMSPRAAVLPGGGAGRGNPENPLRTDRDPTSQAFGASRDFTSELAGVPRELPGDMRDGVIFKTKDANGRTVYSGRNVGADAQMVDGMGRTQTGGGTVSTVPGMSRQEIDRTLGRGAFAAPAGGSGPSTPSLDGLVASSGLLATPKARRAAMATQQASEQLANQRRGQDMTAATSAAELADKRAAREAESGAEAAKMARRASYVEAAGGDTAKAARLALQAGDTASADALSGAADSQDSREQNRQKTIDELLKPLARTTDEDGQPVLNDALLQDAKATLEGMATQQGIPVEQLLQDAPTARAAIATLRGVNDRQKNTIMKALGLDSTTRLSALPAMPAGRTQSENVGFIRGALTPGVERGDRRIMTPDGDFYIPADVYADENVQRFIRARGAN